MKAPNKQGVSDQTVQYRLYPIQSFSHIISNSSSDTRSCTGRARLPSSVLHRRVAGQFGIGHASQRAAAW